MKIHYCSQCGSAEISYRIPAGDNRPRYTCLTCEYIHYTNPNIVAGCLITSGDKILFCKRAIEPRKGLWTLPAGFMENHETMQQAAARETWEEARAEVEDMHIYTMFNLPHINQVYVMYRAKLVGDRYEPGPESTDVQLFKPDNILWDELAFPTIRETLKLYLQDVKQGEFKLHYGDIIRPWVLRDARNAYLVNLKSR